MSSRLPPGCVVEGITTHLPDFMEQIEKIDGNLTSKIDQHTEELKAMQEVFLGEALKYKVLPIDDSGELDLGELPRLITERTKLLAVTHASNALGTVNPIRAIIRIAHDHDVPVLVDGAQGIPHLDVDVQDLDCDFLAFSGHKMFAPNGVGALYAKRTHLDDMPPYHGGGDMIA